MKPFLIEHDDAEELIREFETAFLYLRRAEKKWQQIRTKQIIRMVEIENQKNNSGE